MSTTAGPQLSDLAIVQGALEDDYEVTKELGRGGMAVVYQAREKQLDRDVAVKVLPFTLAFDAELVERFEREARTAAQLEHPHIVPIYRVGRSGQVIYFVMKFLRGQSLSARLKQRGRLEAGEVRRVLMETASALGYAHRHGIVHRDVKPDNIMLDDEGRCTVTDFGIARSAADATKLTATGMSIGTPRYMSPEQARAREVDGRSDLYSLGVVGYECLVGRTPFDGGDALAILMDQVQAPVPRPALADEGSDEERALWTVIERLLAKSPAQRFQSAEELIAALEAGGPVELPLQSVATVATMAPTEPQSSAALDAALAAGIELLKQQRPRMEAGLAAGRRLVKAQQPKLRAALEWTRPRATAAARATGTRARGVLAWLRTRDRRTWRMIAGGAAALVLAYAGIRHAVLYRSRCPSVAARSGDTAEAKARAFSVLVDAPGARPRGSDLHVYYDVCGLEGGTVRTRIAVVKNESGLKRLLGGSVGPVTASEEDEVSGPAMRRHQRIAFSEMPAGSYTLEVSVTDAKGRRRERAVEFLVR